MAAKSLSPIRFISDLWCFFVKFFAVARRAPLQIQWIEAYCSKFSILHWWHICTQSMIHFIHRNILLSFEMTKQIDEEREKKTELGSINIKILMFIVIITIRLYYSMHPYKWRKKQNVENDNKRITCSVITLAKKRDGDNSIHALRSCLCLYGLSNKC